MTGNAGANDNSETDIRPLLELLAMFADKTGVAVIGVKHMGKGERENATMRTLGSVAYTSVPRMVLALTSDPNDKDRRILGRSKTNLPVFGDKGFSFTTENPPDARDIVRDDAPDMDAEEAEALAAQMYRCTGFQPWDGDIDRLVSPEKQSGRSERTNEALAKGSDFLKDYLKQGPKNSLTCVDDGNEACGLNCGLDWWRRKVFNPLGGKSVKSGKEWVWSLTN